MNDLVETGTNNQSPQVVNDSATIMQVISRAASDPSCDIDKMERLMAMHERMQASQVETAFNVSMSEAQSEMRPVSADATNPQTRSKYATYAKLDKALRPIYTTHGFAMSFGTSADAHEGFVRVLCYVSHKRGHTRTYQVDMPSDGKGAKGGDVMTKTHAVGAGVSYGCRYLLKMIFNVAVGEDDDDGNVSPRRTPEDIRAEAAEAQQKANYADAVKKARALAQDIRKAATVDDVNRLATMATAIDHITDDISKRISTVIDERINELSEVQS